MDETSRKILRLLQKEPGLTVAEIGARVGLSHTPCWRRIKEMEKLGVIRDRVIRIDPRKVGFDVSVFCFVRLKQHDEQTLLDFEKAVRDMPEVVQCYSMTGDHDYVLRVLTSSVRQYEEILKKALLRLPGVGFVNSSFALDELNNTLEVPL